jgi:hypothetical protein
MAKLVREFDLAAWLMAEPGRAVAHAAWHLDFRWNYFHAVFNEPEVQLVLCHTRERNRRALISLAQAGYPRAHLMLLAMAQFLHATGDHLPYWLQDYFFGAVAPQAPAKKPGRDPLANIVRDTVIGQAVQIIARDCRIRHMRNRATGSVSSCSVITHLSAAA